MHYGNGWTDVGVAGMTIDQLNRAAARLHEQLMNEKQARDAAQAASRKRP